MTGIHRCFRSSAFLLILAAALAAAPPGAAAKTTSIEPGVPTTLNGMVPQGRYVVFVQTANGWLEAGRIACDREFRTQELDLSAFLPAEGPVRVKIAKMGGGAAHIDTLSLGGVAPTEVRGSADPLASIKIVKKDFDVIDAAGEPLDFVFPRAGTDARLSLTARIEAVRIAETPFLFPVANSYKPVTAGSEFYEYALDSRRTEVEGTGRAVEDRAPFFKEYSAPGTGHPAAYTYGWVTNDDRYLYVTIDFAADDTRDGAKDYTKVFVRTEDGVREFKLAEGSTRWGTPRFIYTDKASYQHKVYDFRIPLAALGTAAGAGKTLRVAFAAYGTAALPSPAVIETSPADGATGVARSNLAIWAMFNQPMNPADFSSETFTLYDITHDASMLVPIEALSYVDNTATMDLGAVEIVLDPLTEYEVRLSRTIHAMTGSHLNGADADTTWTFTTGEAAAPEVTDNTLHLFAGSGKSPGCTMAPSGGSGATRAGAALLLVLPAAVLLARRALRSRRPKTGGSVLPFLLAGVFALSAATANAGMLGAPAPDTAAGKLSLGAGYFYDQDKWKPDTRNIEVVGGPDVTYEEPKIKQQFKYIEGAVGLCARAQGFVRLGVADRNAPQSFEGPTLFSGAVGVRANLYQAPSFRIGTVLEATFAPTSRRDVTFVDEGTTWSGKVRIVHPWTVNLGVAAQAWLGPAVLYLGPMASYGEFEARHDLVSPTEVHVNTKYKEKNNFGGFAGAGVTLLKKLTLGLEAQYRSELSGGASLTYAF